jgi:hypothetical protein
MVTENPTSGTLYMKGPARALEAFLTVSTEERSLAVDAIIPDLDRKLKPIAFARVLTPGIARIRVRFERHTPAGVYQGTLRIGSIAYPFVAEVDAASELRALPSSLTFRAVSDSQARAEITLVNSGNGDYEVRKLYAFGVFQEGGLEEALGKAYRAGQADRRRWIDRVGDNLTDAHGGLARIQVQEGFGALPPGQLRRLALLFHFPGNLRPGHTYTGEIEFGELIYSVRIDVPRSDKQETTNEPVPEL